MNRGALVLLLWNLGCLANEAHRSEIQNIDFIYLINLDKRPDRLKSALEQLSPYNIYPYRFPAILGSELSNEELNRIGLVFSPDMELHRWVLTPSADVGLEYDFLRSSSYGKTVFDSSMSCEAIGCALSHLSVLQDAYDSGYETIWIIEDDILIQDNPHTFTALISKLDGLTGEIGWDILYTDGDEYSEETDVISGVMWWMWRPDNLISDSSVWYKRSKVGDDFIKIGARSRTHSMIVRRSGMKKILDHIKCNGLFLPYDHEIAFAEGIQLYMLKHRAVFWIEGPSDIPH